MISSLAWIPKGAAKREPEHAHISPDDVEALKVAAAAEAAAETVEETSSDSELDEDQPQQVGATSRALAAASLVTGKASARFDISSAMAELDMEHYDSEDGDGEMTLDRLLGNDGTAYLNNRLERNTDDEDNDSDIDSEEDDILIRDDDLLILAARNEDDVSHLEMWVYEQPDERGDGNLFVHHAVLLPAFPLSLAWLDCDPLNEGNSVRRNLAAVGSFEPGIEIWDMDVLDAVEPIAILGGVMETGTSRSGKKKSGGASKKKKKPELKPGSHEGAVLGLAWNQEFRNVMASASGRKLNG